MGGGFGGKEDMTVEPYLALLVWHTRRPVRMVWSRQESLLARPKRHPFIMRYRTAATARRDDPRPGGGHHRRRRRLPLPVGAWCCSLRGARACGPYRVRERAAVAPARCSPTTRRPARSAGSAPCRWCSATSRRWTCWPRALGHRARRAAASATSWPRATCCPSGEPIETEVRLAQTHRRGLRLLGEPPAPVRAAARAVGRGIACNSAALRPGIWFTRLRGGLGRVAAGRQAR